MIEYTIRYYGVCHIPDYEFLVSCKVNLPFHPNKTDKIWAYEEHQEIEEILIEDETYIIELEKYMVVHEGDHWKTLERMKEHLAEMIEHGWELEVWHSNLPESVALGKIKKAKQILKNSHENLGLAINFKKEVVPIYFNNEAHAKWYTDLASIYLENKWRNPND